MSEQQIRKIRQYAELTLQEPDEWIYQAMLASLVLRDLTLEVAEPKAAA